MSFNSSTEGTNRMTPFSRLRLGIGAAIVAASVAALAATSYSTFEQVPVAAAAIGLTAAKITPPGQMQATQAVCSLETAEIRFTVDGTVPTSTVGHLWEIGETKTINGHDTLVRFAAIRTGTTSGQLDCTETAP
jgi:Na+/H+-dicarboxylate symporter